MIELWSWIRKDFKLERIMFKNDKFQKYNGYTGLVFGLWTWREPDILYPLLLRIYPISLEIEKLFALDNLNQCLLWSRLRYHFHTRISMSDLSGLKCVIWYMSWFSLSVCDSDKWTFFVQIYYIVNRDNGAYLVHIDIEELNFNEIFPWIMWKHITGAWLLQTRI